jgi:hypothetical protein
MLAIIIALITVSDGSILFLVFGVSCPHFGRAGRSPAVPKKRRVTSHGNATNRSWRRSLCDCRRRAIGQHLLTGSLAFDFSDA